MKGSYLGPKLENDLIEADLKLLKANYKKYEKNETIILTAKNCLKKKP